MTSTNFDHRLRYLIHHPKGLWSPLPFLCLLLASLLPQSASAQAALDYCVRCTVPQGVSICSIVVDGDVVSVSEWQAYCAAQVAFDGGHHHCKASASISDCPATERFAYTSTPGQGISPATRTQYSTPHAPGQGQEPDGFLERTTDAVMNTGEEVGDSLASGARSVGKTVRDGADVAGEVASEMGRGVVEGAKDVGDGIARGVGCVFTLGRQC